MGRYLMCANCGNVEAGTSYYKCKQCGKFFCSSCATGFRSIGCPHCGFTPLTVLGLNELGKIG